MSPTNASWNDYDRPRPWRSKLPLELQNDWWQIEAREASRGPGPRLRRTSNQYQRAGASHVSRVLVSRTLSKRCANPGMRPRDPNLLTHGREACSQTPSLRHWSRSRARGLLEILWFARNFSRERCGSASVCMRGTAIAVPIELPGLRIRSRKLNLSCKLEFNRRWKFIRVRECVRTHVNVALILCC